MGMSAEAVLVYGVDVGDGIVVPWEEDGFDHDCEAWWLSESGWDDSGSPFDENGFWRPGLDSKAPLAIAYFKAKQAWKEAHPMPVRVVTYCCDASVRYLIVVPGAVIVADWAEAVEVHGLSLPDGAPVIEFVKKYLPGCPSGPKWLLAAGYW